MFEEEFRLPLGFVQGFQRLLMIAEVPDHLHEPMGFA
jgi:hypothetical protein